ncbi:ATP-binding cassette domain-containing protein [Vibrio porteresiae]|uniref:UvrABC system protein A n=1 Tax=Vibrio porteresiae DSM 19223 TaxID=1123496 RepID=A0ABZ0QHQ2_9VIBR|nr:ATP-binding cassette domain-containing protein [Vibrio porteresiae]WPC75035.1 ATP-binding cassette domain-containing protein [Vibrio porteresiae DSM 19223]
MGKITLDGITTNNLKSLSINVVHQKITGITGVSGGGKSSLGYHTLHKLCRNEFEAIESGTVEIPRYKVNKFSGLIPSVSISQENRNNNPLSSIYTFLNIYQIIIAYGGVNIEEQEKIIINSHHNTCKKCQGMGYIKEPDLLKIFDYSKPIKECIKIKNNKVLQTFIAYCKENIGDLDKTIEHISDEVLNGILYGKHKLSSPVKFKLNGRERQSSFYNGLIDEISKSTSLKNKLFLDSVCPSCLGSRINTTCSSIKVFDIPFIDFLTVPFHELIGRIRNHKLSKLINTIIELGAGYLTFSRAIPTLSGGELQKLKLSKVCFSEISGILITIDEISAHLHQNEIRPLLSLIKEINNKGNTILLIDHNAQLLSVCDSFYNIGPFAGERGGHLTRKINHKLKYNDKDYEKDDYFELNHLTRNNVINQSIKILKNKINVLVGVSGSGKSSLALAVLEQYSNSIYIRQRSPLITYKIDVASYLGVRDKIINIFNKKQPVKYCNKCNGAGVIRIQRSFNDDIEIECNKCEGRLFTKSTLKNKVNDINIYDFFTNEIYAISKYKLDLDPVVYEAINILNSLSLSHLSLSRKLKNLSGGEIQRLKLARELIRNFSKKDALIIIDEIGAGLDPQTSITILNYLHEIKSKFAAILLVEHKPEIYSQADSIIVIGPGSGIRGGNVIDYLSPAKYQEKYIDY